ncbi:MAG: 3-isopropylmalate dehydratase small subunit [Gemmatimonadetes bacterium]|nr:3-isopropylmalate dehydratase small subunit [Gemmatimonadota bacterium]
MSGRAPLQSITSRYVVLPRENIDTDQIIPARFLKTTERSGLGGALFHDWRYGSGGRPNPDFPLNRPESQGAEILVAGRNFGCGSSREHAVWALQGAGFRAVVSSQFADIFRQNALGNGLLPVQVEEAVLRTLMRTTASSLTVDLAAQTLTLPDGSAVKFPVPAFARHCLLQGMDELDYLLRAQDHMTVHEDRHPPRVNTVRPSGAAA